MNTLLAYAPASGTHRRPSFDDEPTRPARAMERRQVVSGAAHDLVATHLFAKTEPGLSSASSPARDPARSARHAAAEPAPTPPRRDPHATQGRADAPEPTAGLGNYRIVRTIAAGGMGVVYEAEHRHLERRVAIKVMHSELAHDDELRRRFLGEAVSIARLSHPGVVKIFDYGDEPGGDAYLIMEYLDGPNLGDVLEDGPLSLSRALEIARQIASTLAAAHRAGIVHRDIKPDNIMLVRDRYTERDQVKLLDFGVAKFAGSKLVSSVRTQIGRIIGTPLYMSPEQCLSGSVDARSDVYGFGCLLYHMICGRPPFSGPMSDVLMAHCRQEPERLRAHRADVPVSLECLVMQMLAKDPAERPESMDEVADALRAIQRDGRAAARGGYQDAGMGERSVTAVVSQAEDAQGPSRLGRWLGFALILLALAV